MHAGHEWLYVLDGRLRLMLGAENFTVEAGEAVEFSTWTPHWFGAVDGPVELIGLFGRGRAGAAPARLSALYTPLTPGQADAVLPGGS